MNLSLLVIWGLVGWVANRPPSTPEGGGVYMQAPGVYLQEMPGGRMALFILHAIGGIIGGSIYNSLWPLDLASSSVSIAVAASCLGAFLGARLLDNFVMLLGRLTGRGRG